ncbi:hypothetical protein C2G38_2180179 [Gigaspora rosea]|uniref:BTB/POZ domain-containing protein n=1 Tax=Gigaspora rosea TaxID=44941 RepID=A0A397VJM5_9GLOM|nr:hypothetical protein C2G38_2180179 [Gigaspora rosea]
MNNEPIQDLAEDFSNLLKSSEDFDIKIKVGEEPNIKEFKAHSNILSARSTYFKAALSPQWVRRENGIIIFNKPNISPSVFEVIINYIYTGKFFNKNEVNLLDIFIASDEILLDEISQNVERYLRKTASAWNFPKDFIKISKYYDTFTKLYQFALKLVCAHPKTIFESKDFFKIEENTLIRLLKCDDLRLEEIEIWEYLIKWGIENTESILDDDLTKWMQTDFMNLEKVLHNCIPHIRFFQLSYHELHLVINRYKNILPNNLLDEIYKYLSDPKPNYNTLPTRKSPYIFNSNIINAKDAALVASWIDEKKGMPYRFKDMPFKFERIYQANSESFRIDLFHKICDNKGQTFVVIKVRNSEEIIGGYNPLDWVGKGLFSNDDNKFKKTSKSFVFSLFSQSNGAVPRLSRVSYNNEAIFSCMTRGPCFGFLDLWIQYTSRRSVIGISIKHSYEIGIIDKEVFEIEDFEVFQIKKISALPGFAKSIPEKISGFIMYNEGKMRGLRMGLCSSSWSELCPGCGVLKSCPICGSLERCSKFKCCAYCGSNRCVVQGKYLLYNNDSIHRLQCV